MIDRGIAVDRCCHARGALLPGTESRRPLFLASGLLVDPGNESSVPDGRMALPGLGKTVQDKDNWLKVRASGNTAAHRPAPGSAVYANDVARSGA